VDERLFAAFQAAGIRRIHVGLESGSPRIRRDVLQRNYTNAQFLQAVALAKRYGMKVIVFNLIGVPGETFADHMETVRLNRLAQPDGTFTSIFFPYPGTELHRVCLAKGYLSAAPSGASERRRAVLDLPGFSRRQIQRAHTLFQYRVYRGHRPIATLALRTALVKVVSYPIGNLLFRKAVRLPVLRGVRAKLTKA